MVAMVYLPVADFRGRFPDFAAELLWALVSLMVIAPFKRLIRFANRR